MRAPSLHAALDEALDGLALPGRDERPDLGRRDPRGRRRRSRASSRRSARAPRRATDSSTSRRERAQQSWPQFSKTRERRLRADLLEVGVGEHDRGRLAAELERHALDRPGGLPHDLDADRRRAGEADLRDERMLDQRVADDAARPGNDVQDAVRQPGLEPELGVAQGAQGRQARGLEHDAVAGGEGGRRLPVADVEREVPGRDQRRDADRLAERSSTPSRSTGMVEPKNLSTAPA